MIISTIRDRLTPFLERQGVSRRLVSGISWSLIGSVAVYAAKLFMSIVVARFLGQTSYGAFGVITSTILLFATFAGFGLGMTGTKFLAEHRTDAQVSGRIVGLIIAVSVLFGLVLAISIYSFADWLSTYALNDPSLADELRIGSCFVIFIILFNAQVGILTGFEEFQQLALVSAIEGITLFICTAAGAYWYGVTGAIWGFGIASLFAAVYCTYAMMEHCRKNGILIQFSFGTLESSVFWGFGFPALVVLILPQIFTWGTRVILAYQSNGYAELGLLNVGFAWSAVISFFPRQISKPSLPILTNLYAEGDLVKYRSVLNWNILFSLGVTILLVLPITLASKMIMSLYGNEFVEHWFVLVLMVTAFGLGAITISFRDLIASQGTMWIQAGHAAMWGGVLIVSSFLLRSQGAQGIAIAFVFSYIFLLVFQFIYLRLTILSGRT